MEPLSWDERPGDLREPVMVAAFGGWNDAGASASSAVGFLGERLGARRVAAIDPEEFYDFQATRPLVDLTSDGNAPIVWPEVEILAARPADAGHDLVLVAGAEPSFRWRAFCTTVLDAADALGVTRVVTLGSLLADVVHTRPVRLTGMASDDALIAELSFRKPSYAGPTGIVGVLHQAAIERGREAVSIWAPVSHYAAGHHQRQGHPGAAAGLRAASAASSSTSTSWSRPRRAFEIQVTRAVEAEPRLRTLVEQLEQAADEGREGDDGPLPTGEELAEELERFLRERDEPA